MLEESFFYLCDMKKFINKFLQIVSLVCGIEIPFTI